jgi:hypothetical protein
LEEKRDKAVERLVETKLMEDPIGEGYWVSEYCIFCVAAFDTNLLQTSLPLPRQRPKL